MEDRRGELLLREVERRISQENLVAGNDKQGAEKPAAGEGSEAEVITSQSDSYPQS
jgi:hypothetical protein